MPVYRQLSVDETRPAIRVGRWPHGKRSCNPSGHLVFRSDAVATGTNGVRGTVESEMKTWRNLISGRRNWLRKSDGAISGKE
jgi:hypothetical protein